MINPSTPPTIFYADDTDMQRSMMKCSMDAEKIRLLTAKDGIEALRIIEAHRDLIQAVFTDFQMGGYTHEEAVSLDGLTLVHALNNHEDPKIAELPKVIITGATDLVRDVAKERQVSLERVRIIAKPYDIKFVRDLAKKFCGIKNAH